MKFIEGLNLRVELEEDIRQKVYTVIDTNQRMPENEKVLWNDIHDALQKLAFYYEAKNFQIWKH